MKDVKKKSMIENLPILGRGLAYVRRLIFGRARGFVSVDHYWDNRYKYGGDSGRGSFGELAKFKAEVVNSLVEKRKISSVIEFGCGDGNQLMIAEYPEYVGFDVSPTAIKRCKELFADDESKSFKLVDEYQGETADLTISLDVIYHLVTDDVYFAYMQRLFDSAKRYVVIYSSNTAVAPNASAPHVRGRCFSEWVAKERPDFQLVEHIPNRYPVSGDHEIKSRSEFFVYLRGEE